MTSFIWEGRSLVSARKGNVQYAFTYNDEGIRTSKTVNGVEHKYTLNGTQILSEQWGDNLLVFIYDTTGAPIGMKYLNTADSTAVWETYWFEKNLFGDIIAVYNSSGVKQISYVYDAWGNQTVTTHVTGTAAQYNPLRYRGYYYDADFGLYYLQSRYYDSMSFRFISPEPNVFVSRFDTGSGLVGYNVYAYCANNPVNFVDPTGESISLLLPIALDLAKYVYLCNVGLAFYNYFSNIKTDETDIVNNQDEVNMMYGCEPFEDQGCGPVATHNAIILAGGKSSLAETTLFLSAGEITMGYCGAYFTTIMIYLYLNGYQSNVYMFDSFTDCMDELVMNSEKGVAILAYKFHYVAIKYQSNGKFCIHNTGGTSIEVSSLNKFMVDKEPLCLIVLK